MTMLDIEVPMEARTRLDTTDDREEDMRIINNRSESASQMAVTRQETKFVTSHVQITGLTAANSHSKYM